MDSQEFTAHYRAFLPAISKFFAYRADSSDVEGLAAEVFSIAWQKRDKAPAGAELPWLYRIANNVLLNHRRKVKRNFTLPILETDLVSPSADDLVLETVTVRKAWEELKAADRSILALTALEGMSLEDVALTLKISKNAATIRTHRAKKNFSDILKVFEG